MKLLAFSDIHLDWITQGVGRFAELKDILFDDILVTAIKEKVDAVIFCGDLSDPDSGPVVYRAIETTILFAQELAAHKIPSLWIPGNHDIIEDGSGTTTLTPLAAIEGDMIQVAERPSLVRLGGLMVITLPYTATSHPYDPDKHVRDQLAFLRGDLMTSELPIAVVGHMTEIKGVTPGEEAKEMPRGRDTRFPVEACAGVDLLLNGHIHRQQQSPDGVWIPGSLARLTFGEVDLEPGYLIVEV